MPEFVRLNDGWNAEPNSPQPFLTRSDGDILLRFFLNYMKYRQFHEGDIGILRFTTVAKFRLGATNDEGWYLGQCRYSRLAPAWGEFYELRGHDPLVDKPTDWQILTGQTSYSRHF